MAGKDIEVAIERLDIDRHMRHGLGAIDEHAGAMAMRDRDHLLHGCHRPERVRDLRQRNNPCFRRQQLGIFLQNHLAAVIDRGHPQDRAGVGAEHLPGHDVGVMVEPGDYNLIALPDIAAAPGLRDKIDGLGRAARENDVIWRTRTKEAADFFARRLVSVGRARGERMGATVDVRVLVLIIKREPVDHCLRLLRGRCIVEPD